MKEAQFISHNSSYSTAAYICQSYSSSAVSAEVPSYAIVQDTKEQEFIPEDVGKYSVFDIANWFLSKEPITHKKLQKLCYYAQAWCFALKGYRLENTDFEAWIHGPVSPVLWDRFKGFGYDSIVFRGHISSSFAPEDVRLLEDVWDTYGSQSGNALEALTHHELPWLEARNGYEPDERCSVVISPSSMASFYKSIYIGD